MRERIGHQRWPGHQTHRFLPDHAPTDFFLLPSVKEDLTNLSLAAYGAEKALDGVTRNMDNIKFATAFRHMVSACVRAYILVATV